MIETAGASKERQRNGRSGIGSPRGVERDARKAHEDGAKRHDAQLDLVAGEFAREHAAGADSDGEEGHQQADA